MHRVAVERVPVGVIVRASGEVDAFAAPDLEAAFDGVANEPAVVAHLESVSFMDSTVLGLLVRAVRVLTENGARVRVVLPAGVARRIFALTSLDEVLPVSDSLAAALEELEPTPD